MSDEPTKYILKDPLHLIDIIYNDMGDPPEYLFARHDASEHEVIGCGGDYVKRVFRPLDVESLQTQLEELLQEYGARFYADYEVDRESDREQIEVQEAQGRLEGSARKEFANAVLVLFGLENTESEK